MIRAELLALVRGVAERFHAEGYQLFLVGGIVRDTLLAGEAATWADLDLATDARPPQIKALVAPLASAVWTQGERFGTIGCSIDGRPMEITTFRGDVYRTDSRKPAVEFAGAIDADLSRRDFTINAMAADALTGEVYDPFDGRGDLIRRILRTPSGADTSFSDDPLRMLRAARFVARFGLTLAADIEVAVARQRDRLSIVSAERVRDEVSKLLAVDDPSAGLQFLCDHQLLVRWLPELSALATVHAPSHGGPTALQHTVATVAHCRNGLPVRLAALVHDLSLVADAAAHPEPDLVRRRLRDLRYPNDVVRDVSVLVGLQHRLDDFAGEPSVVRALVLEAGELLDPLVELLRASALACGPRHAAERLAATEAFAVARAALGVQASDLEPALDGVAIMALLAIGPGPAVGEAHTYLQALAVERGPISRAESAEALMRWWTTRQHRAAPGEQPPR